MASARVTRRRLLARAAGAGAALGFPYVLRGSEAATRPAPSERIVVGCIGVGGMGRHDMGQTAALPDAQVVAVCDVKPEARELAKNAVDALYKNKDCRVYADFRELVARPDLDAIQIASTDCWHVLHALAAVRAGKDVYVEKPLGVSLDQCQVLRAEVQRRRRIFQFGTQQRSMPVFRQACELALNGRLGKVHTIRVSAPSGFAERTNSPTYPIEPVPTGFDYDMWLGPAPEAPYTPKRVVNPHWFHISDYALGYIAGWGIHHVDIAQWGSGHELTGPVEVEGTGLFPTNDGLCDTLLNWDVWLTYANGVRVNFTSDGGRNRHGITFEGSDGWVYVHRSGIEASQPALLAEKFGPGDIQLPVSTQHQRNFIDSVRSRQPTICPIDVAVRSETICHLSDIAIRLGRKLKWDPGREEFVGDEQANRMLTRAMRSPWHV